MNKEQLIELLQDKEVMFAVEQAVAGNRDLKTLILDTVEDRLGNLTTLREYNDDNIFYKE